MIRIVRYDIQHNRKIRYIGVDDTDLDLFESQYIVPNGISYNSYLILDEKVAIMDTVDLRKSEEWWSNLDTALEGRSPDYLVVHRMGKLIVAASSYDADVFPPMHDFLHHLKLKAYQKRRVGIIENGSWSPCAAKVMTAMLELMKEIEIVQPTVTIRSRMKQTDLPAMEALADAMLG